MINNKIIGNNPLVGYTYDRAIEKRLIHAVRNSIGILNNSYTAFNTIFGQPVISVAASRISLHIPYYIYADNNALTVDMLNILQDTLTKTFGKPVEMHFLKLTEPYLDAHILAQYLAKEISSQTFTYVIKRLFSSISPVKFSTNILPAYIVGIKVRLAGRLLQEKTRPRITVQSAEIGSLTVTRTTSLHLASYTAVNIKGSYTVKVWLCQRQG